MASDSNIETPVVIVSSDVEPLPDRDDSIKQETFALIDAIKKRAQAEVQAAGDLTRETYLNAVRSAREAIEQNKLIESDRIEHSIQHIQQEAEKNWQSVVSEIESFGTRLTEAAKAAWDKLSEPKA
jgi:gas vesicle protein